MAYKGHSLLKSGIYKGHSLLDSLWGLGLNRSPREGSGERREPSGLQGTLPFSLPRWTLPLPNRGEGSEEGRDSLDLQGTLLFRFPLGFGTQPPDKGKLRGAERTFRPTRDTPFKSGGGESLQTEKLAPGRERRGFEGTPNLQGTLPFNVPESGPSLPKDPVKDGPPTPGETSPGRVP